MSGPLLFVYINDLCNSSEILDDNTNVIISGSDVVHMHSVMNTELGKVADWCGANDQSLNVKKIIYMINIYMIFRGSRNRLFLGDLSICIVGSLTSRVGFCRFLGLIVDENLNYCNLDIYYLKSFTNSSKIVCILHYAYLAILTQSLISSILFDPQFSKTSSVHSHNMRSSQNYKPVFVKSKIKPHSILCLGPRIYARIPLNITDQPNLHAFKRLFKQLIIDSPLFL